MSLNANLQYRYDLARGANTGPRVARRLEADRAAEASRYRRTLAPLRWYQRVDWWPVLGVVALLASAVLLAAVARRVGF